MENPLQAQFFDSINKAKNVLIALPKDPTIDAVAGALALRLFLEKLQKEVVIASGGDLPKNAGFLPRVSEIQKQLNHNKSFVVVIKSAQNKLEELSYQTSEEGVKIYLKSAPQPFVESDVSFESESQPFDAIIILGAASLPDLGGLFEQNPDLFFQAPKINIDHKPGNEYYGAINIVDINATSVAEILTQILESYEKQLFDEDMATCLLTGIISQTNSFQRIQTTPKVFLQASRLMAMGGRQQEVIKHLFKTRSLQFLRLWGRALAKLKLLDEARAMYSVLLLADFQKAESNIESLSLVLKELMENIHGYRLVCVLGEREPGNFVLAVSGHQQVPSDSFVKTFGIPAKQGAYGLAPYWVYEFEIKDSTAEAIEIKLLELLNNPSAKLS